eukprot:3399268-Rhodomonas_salina.1
MRRMVEGSSRGGRSEEGGRRIRNRNRQRRWRDARGVWRLVPAEPVCGIALILDEGFARIAWRAGGADAVGCLAGSCRRL